jgi:hypothetical protein
MGKEVHRTASISGGEEETRKVAETAVARERMLCNKNGKPFFCSRCPTKISLSKSGNPNAI